MRKAVMRLLWGLLLAALLAAAGVAWWLQRPLPLATGLTVAELATLGDVAIGVWEMSSSRR